MSDSSRADVLDISTWVLGSISAHYEANVRGPETVSSGKNDPGGVSYGIYQLSSLSGTVAEYLKHSPYEAQFKGFEPGTASFNAKWIQIANSDPHFDADQRSFIAKTHYFPQIARLKADGVDLSHRGIAVQEALWSTSIQSRDKTKSIFEGAFQKKFGENYKRDLDKISGKDLVSAVQDYKLEYVDQDFRSSKNELRNNIRKIRIPNEKHDLIELAEGRNPYRHKAHEVHKEYSWLSQMEEGRKLRQQEEQSTGQTVIARSGVRIGH